MNDDTSGNSSKTAAEARTDWSRAVAMTDQELRASIADDPEVKPTDDAFWKDARMVIPCRKETITIRLDSDLLAWFRRQRGYQTRINAILRAYMSAQSESRG